MFEDCWKLSKGSGKASWLKDGIISKAAGPHLGMGNPPPNTARNRAQNNTVFSDDQAGLKISHPKGSGFELQKLQEFNPVGLVSSPGPGKAGRIDPRTTPKRWDDQTAVVGQNGMVRNGSTQGAGLDAGIGGESFSGFSDIGKMWQAVEVAYPADAAE